MKKSYKLVVPSEKYIIINYYFLSRLRRTILFFKLHNRNKNNKNIKYIEGLQYTVPKNWNPNTFLI